MAPKAKPIKNISKAVSETRKAVKRVTKAFAKKSKLKQPAVTPPVKPADKLKSSYSFRDFHLPKSKNFAQFMAYAETHADEIDKLKGRNEAWVATFLTPTGNEISTKKVYTDFQLLVDDLINKYFGSLKDKSMSNRSVTSLLSTLKVVKFKAKGGIPNVAKTYQKERTEKIKQYQTRRKETFKKIGVQKGQSWLDALDNLIETTNRQQKQIDDLLKQLAKSAKKATKKPAKKATKPAAKKAAQKKGNKNAKPVQTSRKPARKVSNKPAKKQAKASFRAAKSKPAKPAKKPATKKVAVKKPAKKVSSKNTTKKGKRK